MTDPEKTGTEQCERCSNGEATAQISLGANYDGSMESQFEICNGCVRSLGEWFEDDGLRADGGHLPSDQPRMPSLRRSRPECVVCGTTCVPPEGTPASEREKWCPECEAPRSLDGQPPATDGGQPPAGKERSTLLEDDRHGAVFDSEREYRYSLTRTWDPEKQTLAWIMLNPSTADETQDDPTIRRCLGYAEDWGYGEIVVANLFALRATDPNELREHPEPVGEDNDEHLRRVTEDADRVVAAWGANGDFQNRGREVARTLDADLYALDTTKDCQPVHPLYQPADAKPVPWDEPGESP